MSGTDRKRKRISNPEGESSREDDIASPGDPPIAHQEESRQLSHLLRLPHELLLVITSDLLIEDTALTLHHKRRFEKKNAVAASSSRSPLLSILLASRALYFAGVEAFYRRNTLRFEHAEHLRHFVSGLGYDQRWWIHDVEIDVEWVRSRNAHRWYPLHEINYCSEWKDVIRHLPNLKTVAIRSVTKYGQSEMCAAVDTGSFETKMRNGLGSDQAGILKFVWPTVEQM